MGKAYDKFLARQAALEKQYDAKYYEKQHNRGKLTARERIELLFDPGSFQEVDAYATPAAAGSFGKSTTALGDGVITGYGTIGGKQVYAFSQDFNVLGGSLGSVHAAKIVKIQSMALKTGSPLIALIDSLEYALMKQDQKTKVKQ